MAKYLEVYRRVEVDITCCDHCHGNPEDCPGDALPVVDPQDWKRAMALLQDAHLQLRSPQTAADWLALALQDDIRWFLHKCGRDVIR